MPQPTERHLAVYIDYRGEHPEVCIDEPKTGLRIAEGMRAYTVLDAIHLLNALVRREVDPEVLQRSVPDEPPEAVWPSLTEPADGEAKRERDEGHPRG